MQNPCLPYVDLTLHKVWDDLDNYRDAAHPDRSRHNVTFLVYQVEDVPDGEDVTRLYQTVSLSASDANEWAEAVWTRKMNRLPLYSDQTGNRLSYYVTEQTTGDYLTSTAYADADVAHKLNYYADMTQSGAEANYGYVAKITNQIILDQVIVVDYGLPVPVRAAQYYEYLNYDFTGTKLTLKGVSAAVANSNAVALNTEQYQTRIAKGAGALRFGTASITEDGLLAYAPNGMQMAEEEILYAAIERNVGGNVSYLYGKIRVIPASVIYYEDSFISFNNGFSGRSETADMCWMDPTEQSPSQAMQDEDRPGVDNLDANSLYGYDSAYSDSTTYSLDHAKVISVGPLDTTNPSAQWPTAEFVFTGTGFDIIAVTDRSTGFMRVDLYTGTDTTQPPLKSWGVDTFYGCTREDNGYIRYLFVWGGDNQWHVVKTAYPDMTEETVPRQNDGQYPVRTDFPDRNPDPTDENSRDSFVVYRKNYTWRTNTGSDNQTLYQVPVLTSGDKLEYGTYTVRLTPMYASFFDHNKQDGDNSYKLYVDAVRIYRPSADRYQSIYAQDLEGWPQFIELRRLLLNQDSFGQVTDSQTGMVFIDALGGCYSVTDYQQIGPNNEIYLMPGQAVAFALRKNEQETEQPIYVHVSMKKIFGGVAEVSFLSGKDAGSTISFTSSTECYYDISQAVVWTDNQSGVIVISNPESSDATVSLRNLKVTYETEPDNREQIQLAISPSDAETAVRLLNDSEIPSASLDETTGFAAASVNLKSDLSLNFYVPSELLEDAVNPYVMFTKKGQDGTVVDCRYYYEERELNGTPCNVYTFNGISAAEMGSEVTARLFYTRNGEDHVCQTLTYSVKQYAMEMLQTTEDEALQTLLVDLLNYGAMAQQYFGVRPNAPVNAELTEEQKTLRSVELTDHYLVTNTSIEHPVSLMGASLSLRQRVAINYFVDLTGSGLTANQIGLRLTYTDLDGAPKTVVLDGGSFKPVEMDGKTVYLASFDQMNAAQMRTVVSATVFRKDSQEPVSGTLQYNVETYALNKTVTQEENPDEEALRRMELSDLVQAMMLYGDSAAAYLQNLEGE